MWPMVAYNWPIKEKSEAWCFSSEPKRSVFPQIDEDMTARISMADVKFSFQCPGRMYSPAWVAPEGRHQSCCTDLKRQLESLRLRHEWWMHKTWDSCRNKCNPKMNPPSCQSESKKMEGQRNTTWLQKGKITRKRAAVAVNHKEGD